MRYLLDTNIVSDLVRNPQGKVAPHPQGWLDASLYQHYCRSGVALWRSQERIAAARGAAGSGAWGA